MGVVGFAALGLAFALGACGKQAYEPAPIDPASTAERLSERRLGDPAVAEALAAAGLAVPVWPPAAWSLAALTVAAIHHDPEVATARAAWRALRAAIETAGLRANPVLEPGVAYDTDPDDGDPHWTAGLAVEIPIPGADKRAARIARAEAESEAVRHGIARAAWQRRAAVRRAFLACNRATLLRERVQGQLALHEEIVGIFERRRALGESSLTEVNLARQGLDRAEIEEAALAGDLESCRGALASALGIPFESARALPLDARDLSLEATQPPASESARRRALLGRADLRAALAAYAAAEAALRLEVARQYPDISVTPALFWDQGGLVWSLGASLAAAAFHRNEGPIAEARAARDAAAQGVLAVQARVLAELAQADAAVQAARAAHDAAAELLARAETRLELARRRMAGGDIGRLEVIQAELGAAEAGSALLAHKLDLLALRGAYEDVVESVLVGDTTVLDVTALAEGAPSWFERAP